ncbi:uncharacterized protein H6S33_002730 [Morchella sextelata]|uniref:uncharacterized protein n=1 Tax=Morchella sextelata TaxID=1174677 RepID=UPI001D050F4C|nr:uncharacterized protein H6S33_002730 [Morchella sextelata]KAH0607696.1 hypothetical protein H6S33_002730 [Morchella sextelata]
MERSDFKVDTQLLVNSEGRHVFVPVSLLALGPVNEVIGLEYQPPGASSSGKMGKKRLPWEAQKVNLDHYYMVTDKPEGQHIFAHAIAICSHKKYPDGVPPLGVPPLGEDIIQHSMDDQFLFEDTSKGQETLYAKRDLRVQVFSLNTAEIGFVNATCLVFFPHYKVAKSFKWDTADRSQVENKVGDIFTIGQRSWIMSWTPEGTSKSTPHLCTFGRNMITRYSGVVPMDKLVELEPHELEQWRNQNALPAAAWSAEQYQNELPAWFIEHQNHTGACCKHGEGACLADGGPNILEQMRRENGIPPWPDNEVMMEGEEELEGLRHIIFSQSNLNTLE